MSLHGCCLGVGVPGKGNEERITKGEVYVAFLENRYSDATSKVMELEVQLNATNLKIQGVEAKARKVKERATTTKAMARVAKAEMAQAIKEYKKLMDFEDEVDEAGRDAF